MEEIVTLSFVPNNNDIIEKNTSSNSIVVGAVSINSEFLYDDHVQEQL